MIKKVKCGIFLEILAMGLLALNANCIQPICQQKDPTLAVPNCATVLWNSGVSSSQKSQIHKGSGATVKSSYFNTDEVVSDSLCYSGLKDYYQKFTEVNTIATCNKVGI